MSQYTMMISAVLAIFAAMGLGALARQVNWLTEEADHSLLEVIIRLLLPALILDATLGNKVLLQPANLLVPPLVGFATIVGGMAIGYLVARALGSRANMPDDRTIRTFALCVGIYNYGYVPIPLATTLFDENTLAVLFVHNLGVEIALWTVGVMLVSGQVDRRWYRQVFNPPALTIIASLLLTFSGLYRYVPTFLYKAIHLLGAATIPMALLLIGATIYDVVRGTPMARGGRALTLASFLRLGILPAIFLLMAAVLPISRELKQVLVLQAGMPCAVFPVVMARRYGGDAPTAVRLVLGTGLLSLATMPLWLSAGLRLLAEGS